MYHNLHPVSKATNTVQWCVPSALSSLTGCDYGSAAHACIANGAALFYNELSGVQIDTTILALRQLVPTATVEQVNLRARYPSLALGPTLKRYMREREQAEVLNPCLIGVNNHMIVGHLAVLSGNDTMGPVPYTMFPKLGRNVNWVGIVRGVPYHD